MVSNVDLTLADVKVGDKVRAFHPRSLGVIWSGEIVSVGRKYVHVKFGVDGRTYKLLPKYITAVNLGGM